MTALQFLNHVRAGLTLAGYEDGGYVWIGEDKNWTMLGWLEDGVYGNGERDQNFIRNYLTA